MVKTRSIKEHQDKEKATEEQTLPAREDDLGTRNQSIDGVETKTTESTPMLNAEKQEKKTSSHRLTMQTKQQATRRKR